MTVKQEVNTVEDSKDSSAVVVLTEQEQQQEQGPKTKETQQIQMGITDSDLQPSWFTPKRS